MNKKHFRHAPVAQLDRVFGYEPKGRGFESLLAYQMNRFFRKDEPVFLFFIFETNVKAVEKPSLNGFLSSVSACQNIAAAEKLKRFPISIESDL